MSYTLPLQGHRLANTSSPRDHAFHLPDDVMPGDYWFDDGLHCWVVSIPGGPIGRLENHHVNEHEDGTITVAAGAGGISNSIPGRSFHGYIDRGWWHA